MHLTMRYTELEQSSECYEQAVLFFIVVHDISDAIFQKEFHLFLTDEITSDLFSPRPIEINLLIQPGIIVYQSFGHLRKIIVYKRILNGGFGSAEKFIRAMARNKGKIMLKF